MIVSVTQVVISMSNAEITAKSQNGHQNKKRKISETFSVNIPDTISENEEISSNTVSESKLWSNNYADNRKGSTVSAPVMMSSVSPTQSRTTN